MVAGKPGCREVTVSGGNPASRVLPVVSQTLWVGPPAFGRQLLESLRSDTVQLATKGRPDAAISNLTKLVMPKAQQFAADGLQNLTSQQLVDRSGQGRA